MRQIGEAGLNLIKKFEGCRLEAYKDPAGVWTIGYGHTLGVKQGQTITQEQADQYLREDCQKFADYVDNPAYVPVTAQLNDNQRDALISFAFNCGQGNLKTLCAGRTIAQIAEKMPLYNKAGGKVLNGLVKRHAAEVELFNTPVATVQAAETTPAGFSQDILDFQRACNADGITDENGNELKEDGILGTHTKASAAKVLLKAKMVNGKYKVGSTGVLVEFVQFRIGFTGADIDRKYGADTRQGVIAYQENHGLTADGIVGVKTITCMLGC